MKKTMYSVKETAKELGVCDMTIYRLVKSNNMPHKRVGRSIKIPVSYIENLIKDPVSDLQRFIFN